MCFEIPGLDELQHLAIEVGEVGEVGSEETLALENGKPLLDLIHPGAMNRCEVHTKPRVSCQPGARDLAVMNADVVADEVNAGDSGRCHRIDLLEQFEKFNLALPLAKNSGYLPGSRVESGEEVDRAFSNVLVLEAYGHVVALRGLGRRRACSRLERGLLVEAQHAFVRLQRPRVEVTNCCYLRVEGFVPRHLRTQPVVHSPRLQLV